MNAERTVTETSPVFGIKALRFRLRKLACALGICRPQTLTKPVLPHPLPKLTFHEGAICELHRGQPGRRYMFPCAAEVAGKLSFREIPGGPCEYRFELNAPVDPVWRNLFQSLLPDLPVRFDDKVMTLLCFPENLESSYERIKDAIAWTNLWHVDEWEELLAKVVGQDDEQAAARELEENHRGALQRQFDGLEI